MKDRYFFGRTLARCIDAFAFARTGSHLFRHCTAGLFDLVAIPQPGMDNDEAIARQEEIEPCALYALDLREDGVPYSPVVFNMRATGQHGFPEKGPDSMVVIIRDPIPTLYSFFRVSTDRWGQSIDDPPLWVRAKFQRYAAFYDTAFEQIAKAPADSLLIRYEDLLAGTEPLQRLVDLVGVRPKLSPAFVHSVTRFDAFARPGKRTFYRAGDNEAWRSDARWCDILQHADLPNLARFEHRANPAPSETRP